MDIRTIIAESNIEIKKWTQSKQYKYSRKLMSLRYKKSMACEEMADHLNIPLDEYIKLEYGDLNVNIDDYVKIFKLLK